VQRRQLIEGSQSARPEPTSWTKPFPSRHNAAKLIAASVVGGAHDNRVSKRGTKPVAGKGSSRLREFLEVDNLKAVKRIDL
jgi:hypothetical protein